MKGFYITVLGLLLAVSFVRFTTGGQALRFTDFMLILKDFPIDVKEDFSVVVKSLVEVSNSCKSFIVSIKFDSASNIFEEVLNVLSGIFMILFSVVKLLVAILRFAILLIYDIVILFTRMFYLIFGLDLDIGLSSPDNFEGIDGFGSFGGGGFGGGGGGAR